MKTVGERERAREAQQQKEKAAKEEKDAMLFILALIFHTGALVGRGSTTPAESFTRAQEFLSESAKRGIKATLP